MPVYDSIFDHPNWDCDGPLCIWKAISIRHSDHWLREVRSSTSPELLQIMLAIELVCPHPRCNCSFHPFRWRRQDLSGANEPRMNRGGLCFHVSCAQEDRYARGSKIGCDKGKAATDAANKIGYFIFEKFRQLGYYHRDDSRRPR